nr:MAG TPA: hypothetical protein [Caudoviricetes sp.]
MNEKNYHARIAFQWYRRARARSPLDGVEKSLPLRNTRVSTKSIGVLVSKFSQL